LQEFIRDQPGAASLIDTNDEWDDMGIEHGWSNPAAENPRALVAVRLKLLGNAPEQGAGLFFRSPDGLVM
jgi:hypothetical protein